MKMPKHGEKGLKLLSSAVPNVMYLYKNMYMHAALYCECVTVVILLLAVSTMMYSAREDEEVTSNRYVHSLEYMQCPVYIKYTRTIHKPPYLLFGYKKGIRNKE